MADLDESIVLLSTMSPKVGAKARIPASSKKVSKLCLRKHFRQSLDFEKVPPRNAALLKDSESIVSSTTGSELTSRKASDEEVLIAPQSDGEEQKGPRGEAACPALSESRYNIVANWLEKVHLNMEHFDDVAFSRGDHSLFSNVSVIYGERRRSNQSGAVNSTFVGGDERLRFDQLFSKGGQADDEETFRKTKSVKDVKSIKGNADVLKVGNRKPGVTVSKIKENRPVYNGDVESNEKRRMRETKRDLHVPCERPRTPENISPEQEEQEKLLDELYGHSWRINKEKVFPQSETKQKKQEAPPAAKRREPQTEKPPKSSAVYRNPYLESEVLKSRNLLSSLHTARARKMVESPMVGRLRDLCDSDTNSEGTPGSGRKLAGTRLVFDECDKENLDGVRTLEDRLKKKLGFEDEASSDGGGSSSEDSGTAESDSSLGEARAAMIIRNAETDVVIKKKKKLRRSNGAPLSFLASLSPNVPASDCDVTARIFRDFYKVYKANLARKLFLLYNEQVFDNVIPDDTPLEWSDKLRGTAGYCRCRKTVRSSGKVEYSVSITLSTKVLDSADRLRNTLIHEMCHAAAYLVNKVSEGHGPHWKAWTLKARSVFPELPPIQVCHNYQINTKYTYKCINCGYCVGRHSKSLNVEKKRCGHCFGKFELHLNKPIRGGGVQSVPVTPKREVTGFALFVKENYAELKTPERKHKDVMQLLSKKFNEMKTQ